MTAMHVVSRNRRPNAGSGSAPDWMTVVTTSGSSSARSVHVNEAREALLVAARQLGPGPAKQSASAMTGLQVWCEADEQLTASLLD